MSALITDSQLDTVLYDSIYYDGVIDYEIRLLIEILYMTGCRINDVLEYDRWSVLMNGNVQLQPQKRNNLRIFTPTELPTLFYDNLVNNINTFDGYYYGKCEYYITEILRKNSIKRNKKYLTTHLYRHNYCKKLHNLGNTDSEIQVKLGLLNLASAQNYIYSNLFGYV